MEKMTQFQKQGKAAINTDNYPTFARANGALEIRDSYYYRAGKSAQAFAQRMAAEVPNCKIVDYGDTDRNWPKLSYFWVILAPAADPDPADQQKARLAEAENMAAHFQYLGNRAYEKGDQALADRHYQCSQKWRDQMNRLLGNGAGNE